MNTITMTRNSRDVQVGGDAATIRSAYAKLTADGYRLTKSNAAARRVLKLPAPPRTGFEEINARLRWLTS